MRMLGIPPGKLNVPALKLSGQVKHHENNSVFTTSLTDCKVYNIARSIDLDFPDYVCVFMCGSVKEFHTQHRRTGKWYRQS